MKKLTRDFYARKTLVVAKELLGKLLVHRLDGIERIGKIVEVEAYVGPHDKACHSAKGLTKRTEIMFGPPGFAYIYMIYGIYHCWNIVTEEPGFPAGVLLRAIEPVLNIHARTSGPGLLCKALKIDKQLNGYDMTSKELFIAEDANAKRPVIVKKPRIGVDYAGDWADKPLRFYIKGNEYISKS
jgi:DNA-3-methyladenine glycosylase